MTRWDPSMLRAVRLEVAGSLRKAAGLLEGRGVRLGRQTILNHETGHTTPNAAQIGHYADAYGVPVDRFYS